MTWTSILQNVKYRYKCTSLKIPPHTVQVDIWICLNIIWGKVFWSGDILHETTSNTFECLCPLLKLWICYYFHQWPEKYNLNVTLSVLIITQTFVLLLCSCVSPSELQFFQFPSLQVLLLDPELIFNKKEVEKIVKCGTWRMSLSTVKVWNFSTSLMFNILALTFFLSSWNCSSWPSFT